MSSHQLLKLYINSIQNVMENLAPKTPFALASPADVLYSKELLDP